MRLVGIDAGTSFVKAAVFTGDGDLIATAARPVPLDHPGPGQVEQDPAAVLRALRDILAELDLSTVDLVALTGQGDGCWLADEAGEPVRPAVSWMDARGSEALSRWESSNIVDEVYRIAGNALFPGAQAAILSWLDEHEPASLDRAATAAYCKDLIFQRLTGIRVTDPSDSSLPFGDGASGYSQKVLELCGLDHRADLLAPIAAPLPVGAVDGGGSEFGLAEGIPVTDGPFDLPACAAGGGVREPGEGLLTIGTTLACQVLVDAVR
ncbi:MAG TPA: FGGY family carbohydrate kinase, partial [Mycobacteriales bacterium]|nr:FGGY family carbohydrate kinase [Mycobacteriales bacterium]